MRLQSADQDASSAPPARALAAGALATFAAWIGIAALGVAGVLSAYGWSEAQGYAHLDGVALQRLDLYAASLESELRRHESLPSLLALDQDVVALLKNPARPGQRERANRSLAKLSVEAGAVAVFLLDPGGRAVASSNWYLPESFVGTSFAEWPLYLDAMQGGQAGYFAAAPATGAPEYFFAQLIRRDGHVWGVAVAKISLEALEATWVEASSRTHADRLLVVDENGVVIMSSVPEWTYKTVAAPSAPSRVVLRASGKYPRQASVLEPLGLIPERTLAHSAVLMNLGTVEAAGPGLRSVAHEKALARPPWRLVTLSDISPVEQNARNAAFAAASLAGIVLVLGIYWRQRRRETAERLATREKLQRAHDELGQRVEERTSELRQANMELVREIVERERTEEILREAQDELVQAGKMALLGQMAAGVSHEINQPLTALRALSDNARVLLERGRTQDVRDNLRSIADLTERMGRITAQLKSFSRKSPAAEDEVVLARAVSNALLLLENRLRSAAVEVKVDVPPPLRALCDGNRLEQVLVNLFANALDAMKGGDGPKVLSVRAWAAERRVMVRVADSGPGIPEPLMPRLFEPFFTTKPQGEGLGLGLVISASIVREFGGVLRVLTPPAGAMFEFDLKLAEEPHAL